MSYNKERTDVGRSTKKVSLFVERKKNFEMIWVDVWGMEGKDETGSIRDD